MAMNAPLLAVEEGKSTSLPRPVLLRAALLVSSLILASCAVLFVALACSSKYAIVFGHTIIAFAFGLRHAVDCDHLAAIDNVTRQLLSRGQWPVSVGFWFALGHSTVVIMMTGVLAGGYSWAKQMASQGNSIADDVSMVAALASITILGGIGTLNAQIASGLFKNWRRIQSLTPKEQEEELRNTAESSLRTALSSIPGVRRLFERVSRPWKMYGVGFLFGLSFDSSTQVGLIGLAAMTGTSGAVPPHMIMIFPVAFSCGMCLIDTSNGLLMLATYSWTDMKPTQKMFYNFLVTSMSAGIALVICTLELLQILAQNLHLKGAFWTFIQNVDMGTIGYSIILSFAMVFGVAVACSRCHSCSTSKSELDEPTDKLCA